MVRPEIDDGAVLARRARERARRVRGSSLPTALAPTRPSDERRESPRGIWLELCERARRARRGRQAARAEQLRATETAANRASRPVPRSTTASRPREPPECCELARRPRQGDWWFD